MQSRPLAKTRLLVDSSDLDKHLLSRLACRKRIDVASGLLGRDLPILGAELKFEHGDEMGEDDTHLQFGEAHSQARMSSRSPTQVTILHLLVFGPVGQIS